MSERKSDGATIGVGLGALLLIGALTNLGLASNEAEQKNKQPAVDPNRKTLSFAGWNLAEYGDWYSAYSTRGSNVDSRSVMQVLDDNGCEVDDMKPISYSYGTSMAMWFRVKNAGCVPGLR